MERTDENCVLERGKMESDPELANASSRECRDRVGARGGQRAKGLAKIGVLRCSERRAHNLLAAAGLGQSQWPMSSSKKSYILTKAKLHTYVEL